MANTTIRQNGTVATVVEDHSNDWEDFAGVDINVDVAYRYAEGDGPAEDERTHWAYRGQAAMCITADESKIVRVRIGDGSTDDRQLYKQEITDPTDASQWETWTVYDSNTNYAVAISSTTGAGFKIYHARTTGIFVNNVAKYTRGGIIRIRTIPGRAGSVFFATVDTHNDGNRMIDWYYIDDIEDAVATEECGNYHWYREDLGAIVHAPTDPVTDGSMFIVRGVAMNGGARHTAASQHLVQSYWNFIESDRRNEWDNADVILGPSGEAGFRVYEDMYLTTQISDLPDNDFQTYYLFFTESWLDSVGRSLSNLLKPLFWCRTKGIPQDWSEPVPTGYSVWGFAGAVQFGDYVYAAGNGRVLRRTTVREDLDLTDYVIDGSFDLPRENDAGTGSLTCANPDNVIGEMLGLSATSDAGRTEKRLTLQLGVKELPVDSDEPVDYTWKENSSWWTSLLTKSHDGNADHLIVDFGDFWHRLDNQFRTTISQPGRFEWRDWAVGADNLLVNKVYLNYGGELFRVADASGDSFHLQTTKGITIFTGAPFENVHVSCFFYADTGSIVFRFVDQQNYCYAHYNGTYLSLHSVVKGKDTLLKRIAKSGTHGFWLSVEVRWNRIEVSYNSEVLLEGSALDELPSTMGFVGIRVDAADPGLEISDFEIAEYNRPLTSAELIRKLLAYVEEFNVYVDPSFADVDQIAKVWGPQSDLDTPAKALQDALGSGKSDVVWRDYGPDEGDFADPDRAYIWVGRFGEDEPSYTIQNEVISQSQVNNGKERPNIVTVDGQVDSRVQYDGADLRLRGRTVNDYIDAPDLLTPGDVRKRAEQEVIDATRQNSPGGDTIWRPEFNRLDTVYWIDGDGNKWRTRIEGLKVEWSQSMQPFQHATIDAGTFVYCPPDTPEATYVARDLFQRDETGEWGDALIGGTWTIV